MANTQSALTPSSELLDLLNHYQRLHDGLSDMVEAGRLKELDIPDDYQWLVEGMLAPLANHPGHQHIGVRRELGDSLEERYLASEGSKCPHCRSTSLEGDASLEISGTVATQDICCNDCGKEWTDTYTLTGLTAR